MAYVYTCIEHNIEINILLARYCIRYCVDNQFVQIAGWICTDNVLFHGYMFRIAIWTWLVGNQISTEF